MIGPLNETPERTHEAILLHLKRCHEMTVLELCQALGITAMAVRRHLAGLKQDGLIESRLERRQRGRPTYRFRLSKKAQSLFPNSAETLAEEILNAVYEQSGHKGVMELLTLRNNYLVKSLGQRLENKDVGERVAAVAKFFSENGFMTEWAALPDGTFAIFQRHCALHNLATQFRQICVLEPRLIQELVGVKVTRKQYMLKNDPVCGYLVHAGGGK